MDGVRSLNVALRPKSVTAAVRASLAYEPSDALNANVSYMHLDRHLEGYVQGAGQGVGYNGPAISPSDRLSVNDELSDIRNHVDIVTAQIDSRIWGQHLSYVGSYYFNKIHTAEGLDTGNLIPNLDIVGGHFVPQERTTHEIKLASDPAPRRFLDYTVGAFYSWTATDVTALQPRVFSGFFGDPRAQSPFTIFPQYQSAIEIVSPVRLEETSFFGSLTAHFGEDTELTIGGRQIISRVVRETNVALTGGLTAVILPAGVPCAAVPGLSTSPIGYGICQAPVPAGVQLSQRRNTIDRPFIYNIALSHRFSADLLVYANHGTAWRYGPQVIGINNGPDAVTGLPDPVLTSLSQMPNETSRSYEIGLKSTLLDGRMRFNVALFRQTFRNLFVRTEPVRYVSVAGGRTDPNALFNFTAAVPATIEGIDIDTALQILPNWNVTAALSYADAGNEDPSHPYVSPLFGDFGKGWPRTLLSTGTRDLLLSDTVRMHRTLRRAGIEAELHVSEAAPHGGFMGANAPEDADVMAECRRFMWSAWGLRG